MFLHTILTLGVIWVVQVAVGSGVLADSLQAHVAVEVMILLLGVNAGFWR